MTEQHSVPDATGDRIAGAPSTDQPDATGDRIAGAPSTDQPDATGDRIAGAPSDNTTLTAVLAEMEAQGYTASFGARRNAHLQCSACRTEHRVAEFDIHHARRFEGASDPDAEAILVAGACPACGTRGTAVFGYGPEASEEDALAVAELDIR